MERSIILRMDAVSVCPNPQKLCDARCPQCEQEWSEMIALEDPVITVPVEMVGEELRICECGTAWWPRLCPGCRADEEAWEKADHDYDSRVEERIVARMEAVERMGGRF